MCGISGFIGKSKNPKLSFELANALFIKTEIRGVDASGFWACERGDKLFYDKEPVKSSIYCSNREVWRDEFAAVDCNLLITHCRLSTSSNSKKVGDEKINRNNHPHVSADKQVALIHNGKIPEYDLLKPRYQLHSECDSEILLSMFESSDVYKSDVEFLKKELPEIPLDLSCRMLGLREIFSRVTYGAMAVAIGERLKDGGRRLWLFRDSERPLHIVDMTNTLGQVFFCSTLEIWKNATDSLGSKLKDYLTGEELIAEHGTDQICVMQTTPDDKGEDQWLIKKYKVIKTKFCEWHPEENVKKSPRIQKTEPNCILVSRLNENEEIVDKKVTKKKDIEKDRNTIIDQLASDNSVKEIQKTLSEHVDFDTDMEKFSALFTDIRVALSSIERIVAEEKIIERDYTNIVDVLKDVKGELEGTLFFLRKTK